MKIVLDTNVLIAASISRGVCHKLVEYCVVEHTIVTSDFILSEWREKLLTKFGRTPSIVDRIIEAFSSQILLVVPEVAVGAVERDPDDDNVVGTAVAGNCDLIITGDRDLLDLKRFGQIVIMAPREFLDSQEVT